jgi:predicted TIM-barrel fold metal-dependent hydrolase
MGYGQNVMDGSWIEWPMNTARTILSLIASGTLRRYPRIRFIFAHGGGVMPLLIRRMAGFADWPAVGAEGLRHVFPEGLETAFAALHFECAQAYAATNLGALRSLVPDRQLLFGSDYPIFPMTHATGDFARAALPARTLRAMARGNAEALLPRWATQRMAA